MFILIWAAFVPITTGIAAGIEYCTNTFEAARHGGILLKRQSWSHPPEGDGEVTHTAFVERVGESALWLLQVRIPNQPCSHIRTTNEWFGAHLFSVHMSVQRCRRARAQTDAS